MQRKKTGSGPTQLLSDLRGSDTIRSICMPHPLLTDQNTPTTLVVGTARCELWLVTNVEEKAYDLKVGRTGMKITLPFPPSLSLSLSSAMENWHTFSICFGRSSREDIRPT